MTIIKKNVKFKKQVLNSFWVAQLAYPDQALKYKALVAPILGLEYIADVEGGSISSNGDHQYRAVIYKDRQTKKNYVGFRGSDNADNWIHDNILGLGLNGALPESAKQFIHEVNQKVDSYFAVGHSLGGVLSAVAKQMAPQQVERVFAIDTPGVGRQDARSFYGAIWEDMTYYQSADNAVNQFNKDPTTVIKLDLPIDHYSHSIENIVLGYVSTHLDPALEKTINERRIAYMNTPDGKALFGREFGGALAPDLSEETRITLTNQYIQSIAQQHPGDGDVAIFYNDYQIQTREATSQNQVLGAAAVFQLKLNAHIKAEKNWQEIEELGSSLSDFSGQLALVLGHQDLGKFATSLKVSLNVVNAVGKLENGFKLLRAGQKIVGLTSIIGGFGLFLSAFSLMDSLFGSPKTDGTEEALKKIHETVVDMWKAMDSQFTATRELIIDCARSLDENSHKRFELLFKQADYYGKILIQGQQKLRQIVDQGLALNLANINHLVNDKTLSLLERIEAGTYPKDVSDDDFVKDTGRLNRWLTTTARTNSGYPQADGHLPQDVLNRELKKQIELIQSENYSEVSLGLLAYVFEKKEDEKIYPPQIRTSGWEQVLNAYKDLLKLGKQHLSSTLSIQTVFKKQIADLANSAAQVCDFIAEVSSNPSLGRSLLEQHQDAFERINHYMMKTKLEEVTKSFISKAVNTGLSQVLISQQNIEKLGTELTSVFLSEMPFFTIETKKFLIHYFLKSIQRMSIRKDLDPNISNRIETASNSVNPYPYQANISTELYQEDCFNLNDQQMVFFKNQFGMLIENDSFLFGFFFNLIKVDLSYYLMPIHEKKSTNTYMFSPVFQHFSKSLNIIFYVSSTVMNQFNRVPVGRLKLHSGEAFGPAKSACYIRSVAPDDPSLINFNPLIFSNNFSVMKNKIALEIQNLFKIEIKKELQEQGYLPPLIETCLEKRLQWIAFLGLLNPQAEIFKDIELDMGFTAARLEQQIDASYQGDSSAYFRELKAFLDSDTDLKKEIGFKKDEFLEHLKTRLYERKEGFDYPLHRIMDKARQELMTIHEEIVFETIRNTLFEINKKINFIYQRTTHQDPLAYLTPQNLQEGTLSREGFFNFLVADETHLQLLKNELAKKKQIIFDKNKLSKQTLLYHAIQMHDLNFVKLLLNFDHPIDEESMQAALSISPVLSELLITLKHLQDRMKQIAGEFSLGYMLQIIENIGGQVQKFDTAVPALIFLGLTGAGKSTLINHILGTDYQKQKVKGKNYLHPLPDSIPELAKTSVDSRSETLYPECYSLNCSKNCEPLILVDTQGMNDNRGSEFEISSDLTPHLLIKQFNQVKALALVCLDGDIFANRLENAMAALFQKISYLIENSQQENLIENIVLIVTAPDDGRTKQEVAEQLRSVFEEFKEEYPNVGQWLEKLNPEKNIFIYDALKPQKRDDFYHFMKDIHPKKASCFEQLGAMGPLQKLKNILEILIDHEKNLDQKLLSEQKNFNEALFYESQALLQELSDKKVNFFHEEISTLQEDLCSKLKEITLKANQGAYISSEMNNQLAFLSFYKNLFVAAKAIWLDFDQNFEVPSNKDQGSIFPLYKMGLFGSSSSSSSSSNGSSAEEMKMT